jgi:hypothetical protein
MQEKIDGQICVRVSMGGRVAKAGESPLSLLFFSVLEPEEFVLESLFGMMNC